jgi:AraC family transcriptional regulator, transcriptional activator of pobA
LVSVIGCPSGSGRRRCGGRWLAAPRGHLRLKDEPLLAEVFGFIEARYHERISLRDVASAVNLTPAHLTTSVRRKTGRSVQQWIAERRMAQARRRLLVLTDLTVEEIGRKVGSADPVYSGPSGAPTAAPHFGGAGPAD